MKASFNMHKERKYDADEVDSLLEDLRAYFEEISLGRGAYNRDSLTHAENCIEHMKKTALKALKLLEENQ